MAIRVSRQAVDALIQETSDLRISRQHVEVLVDVPPPDIRVSRQHVEVLIGLPPGDLRVSRQNVEVLVDVPPPTLRITRQRVEILFEELSDLRVSRQRTNVLLEETPNLRLSKQMIEVLSPRTLISVSASSVISFQQTNHAYTNQLRIQYYGTIHEAETYFAKRLHEQTWSKSKAVDHEKALWAATLIIDALNFKGDKHSVYEVLQANSETIRVAEDSQVLEFPRDADMEVPEEIRVATYEIAHSLLDGKDPDLELEALGIISHSIQDTTTSYNREQVPIEHIINGIPSTQAWRLLRPYLREDDAIILSRIS